ncbi:BlaI/MecI/CopY family transcriptional regulator [Thalassotalea sp. ND16A]|uniref:BlaI/MecI/CopY family transcriptional regulator n=1 Tax=Thalassotalea sp. ND16A TaxID=1535422 RepID=UPI00051A404F|nr:BlaI/MecI/CopY family transcriptional regulator [Thalassotalea sp. ND16A]KGJ98538.1 transcriptional repressor, CopY family [Thalassotalea sp. ND16A]
MKLSEFELDVMQRFWDEGACSAPAIHKWIAEDKKVAYTTVKTIIDRLEEKGAIRRERIEGRSIVYSAAIEKEAISKKLLPDFVRRFFHGNASHLIAHLIKDDELSDEDIVFLEKFLAKRKDNKEE